MDLVNKDIFCICSEVNIMVDIFGLANFSDKYQHND